MECIRAWHDSFFFLFFFIAIIRNCIRTSCARIFHLKMTRRGSRFPSLPPPKFALRGVFFFLLPLCSSPQREEGYSAVCPSIRPISLNGRKYRARLTAHIAHRVQKGTRAAAGRQIANTFAKSNVDTWRRCACYFRRKEQNEIGVTGSVVPDWSKTRHAA